MPDVHVDSMIFQYSFFQFFFSPLVFVSLHFCNHFAFENSFKVNCILGSLICLFVLSVSFSWLSNLPNHLKYKKNKKQSALFSVVMNLLCFDYDKCWCCLDCFELFLCTQQILFSGVNFLISRCVFFLLDSGSPALSPCNCSSVSL